VRYTAVLGLLFLAAGLWAQTPQEEIFRHPLEPQTMNAFIATCSRLAEHPVVQGKFEQEKTLSKLNRSLKSSGNFIIAAGMGMVWDTVKPFPSTLTLGKNYLIQSRPGGQKTILSAQGNETFLSMAEIISAVFSGNSRGLLDNFKVYYSGGAGGLADAAWELGLSPQNNAIGAFAEKIIMKGDTAIMSIIIYEQNGDTIQYIFSNHRYPAELNDNETAFFSFP
jgi:outer membrane lipoprotein-sorting protein